MSLCDEFPQSRDVILSGYIRLPQKGLPSIFPVYSSVMPWIWAI